MSNNDDKSGSGHKQPEQKDKTAKQIYKEKVEKGQRERAEITHPVPRTEVDPDYRKDEGDGFIR